MSVISGNSFVYKRSKPRTRRTDGEDDLHPVITGLPRLRFTLGGLGRDEDFQGLVNLRHWAFGWNVQLISTVKNWFLIGYVLLCWECFRMRVYRANRSTARWHPFQCGPACDWSVLRPAWYMVGAPGSLCIMQQFPMAYSVDSESL